MVNGFQTVHCVSDKSMLASMYADCYSAAIKVLINTNKIKTLAVKRLSLTLTTVLLRITYIMECIIRLL